jgi:hypothetical protein
MMLWKIAIPIAIAAAIVLSLYVWNRERRWTLKDQYSHSLCRVQSGWTQQEVAVHCGARWVGAWQPKVPAGGLQMCSAPADIYGAKVVLYGCDGKVQAVETMPASGVVPTSN